MTKLNKAMSELQLKGIKNKEEGDDVEDKKMEEDDWTQSSDVKGFT